MNICLKGVDFRVVQICGKSCVEMLDNGEWVKVNAEDFLLDLIEQSYRNGEKSAKDNIRDILGLR
jgi:hypothetical protein